MDNIIPDIKAELICQEQINQSTNERETRRNIREALRKIFECLHQTLENNETIGRIIVPQEISRKETSTQKPGKQKIIVDGKPITLQEIDEKEYTLILHEVEEWIRKTQSPLIFIKNPVKEYTVKTKKITVKPDGYTLIKTSKQKLVNIIILIEPENTETTISNQITICTIPFYISNNQPSLTLLITKQKIQLYTLNAEKQNIKNKIV